MMKKNLKLAALALILPALTACNKDDDNATPIGPDANRVAINATAGINTRATNATWHKDDAIGIYMLAPETNNIAQQVNNYKYINTAADGPTATFASAKEEETAYFPTNGAKVDVLAYYPHSAANSQLSTLNSQLSVAVGDQTSLPAIDLMTAERVTGKSKDDPEVALAFTHRLTKVNITLKADQALGDIDLAGATITLGGTPATAVFDLVEQTFTTFGPAADIVLKGDVAIVIPTPAGSGVAFTIEADGKTFTAPLPDDVALGTGEEATITITLKENPAIEADVTATIRPWTSGPTANLDAIDIDIPQNEMNVDPAITRFEIWKNRAEGDARVYTLTPAGWTAWPEPFYKYQIAEGDQFHATATLGTADAITGLSDELKASGTINQAGKLNMQFAHINAQIIVNLSKGEGFPQGDDLSTASFKLLDYNLTGAGNQLIVAPTTISAGTEVVISVSGKTYTAQTAEAIELEAGTINTLAFTLKVESGKSALDMNITRKDWAVGAEVSLTAINIAVPDRPSTGQPVVTNFTLWKNKGTEEAVSAEYAFVNNEWNVTGTPFYVEDTAADDEFTAIHTPSTTPELGLKDVLQTAAVKMKNGALALEFAHVNALLTINLYRHAENNTADLTTATFQLLGYNFTGPQNTLVVAPQTIPAGTLIAVTANEKTYRLTTASAINLTTATRNTLNIILKQEYDKTEIGLQVTAKQWDTVKEVDLTAVNIAVPSNPETGTPEVKQFELIKMWGENQSMAVTYTYAAGKWTTDEAPYYIEDITAGDTFMAIHTPQETDPLSGLTDELRTPVVKMKDGALALEFAHTKARVTVKLVKGAGFPAATNLATAQVKFQEITFTGELNTFLYASAVSFAAGSQIATVTVGGQTYSIKLQENMTLEANSQTVFTFTLTPTEVGITVSLADWNEEVKKDIDTRLDITTSMDFGKLPAGEVKITTGTHTGTYQWSGEAITSSTNPIYWDNLAEADKHTFTMYFSPTAAGTPEKDYLEGTAADVVWGKAINFNLTHVNARFAVNLEKGAGYEDAEFATAVKGAVVTLIGFSTNQHEMGNEEAAIVKPQTIGADQKVKLEIGGHTYTMAMSSVTGITKLEADKKYTLTATVNKTGVGVSVGNISQWGTGGDGTGEFEYE